LNSLFYSNT